MANRAYDVKSVALAIDAPIKWVDNLLSHHAIPGVSGGRQGVQRQISFEGLLAIDAARLLVTELQLPLRRAVAVAGEALRHRSTDVMTVSTAGGIEIALPVALREARLHERLVVAAESIARVPRGRPRQFTRGTS